MNLSLEGFKVYETPTERSFPVDGTYLIQGKSGRGKSTLFAAVAWALYGKESDTYSWNQKKKVCRVEVRLPDGLVVLRQKNPERLEVRLPDGRTLQSKDEAQAEVVRRYGSVQAWTASAYLRQDMRNPLMEGSAAEKVALLEAMAFQDDVPGRFLELATERRREAVRVADRADAVAGHTPVPVPRVPLDSLTHPATAEHYNETKARAVEAAVRAAEAAVGAGAERTVLEAQLRSKEQAYKQIQQFLVDESTYTEAVAYHHTLQKLAAVEAQLAPLLPDVQGLDPALLERYTRGVHAKAAVDAACALCACTPSELSERKRTLEHALGVWTELKQHETFSLAQQPPASTLKEKVPFPAHVLQAAAAAARADLTPAEAKELLAMEPYVAPYRAYVAAEAAYSAHTAVLPATVTEDDLAPEALEELEKRTRRELESLRAGLDVHTCPHCKHGLRLVQGRLLAAEGCPSTQADVKTMEALLVWVLTTQRLGTELDRATEQLGDCPFSPEQLGTWSAARAHAARTAADVPPYSVEEMERHNTALAHAAERERREAWASSVPDDVLGVYDRLEGDRQRAVAQLTAVERAVCVWADAADAVAPERLRALQRAAPLLEQQEQLEEELGDENDVPMSKDELEAQASARAEATVLKRDLKTLVGQLSALRAAPVQSLEELRAYAAELAWMPRFLEDSERAAAATAAAAAARAQADAAVQMVERIKTVSHTVLSSYLETFNATLETVLAEVFDDPIVVSLQLFKGDKPDAKWALVYKGTQDNSLSELSGGEKDRVSLAITVALASLSHFPVLMLDECFRSLDSDARAACLETLKRVVHKPVYVVAHGEVEGDYDTMLDL